MQKQLYIETYIAGHLKFDPQVTKIHFCQCIIRQNLWQSLCF